MTYGAETASIYTDFQGLADLRRQAKEQSPEALRKVAQQFEALFMQTMLKGMRDTGFGTDLFDSDQMKFYQGMFDKQIALSMAEGKGLGLADMLVRQLSPDNVSVGTDPTEEAPSISNGNRPVRGPERAAIESPEDFVRVLQPLAREAERELGVPHKVLLAQAALETGWGQRVLKSPDGTSSYNLFNIKADGRWPGDRVHAVTLEYENGVAVQRRAAFRAYPSYAESFADYIDFLRSSPRYRAALNSGGDDGAFARALQSAGYATDPDYARKINAIVDGPELSGGIAMLKNAEAAPL